MIDAVEVVPFSNTVKKQTCCVGVAPPDALGQGERTEENVFPLVFIKNGFAADHSLQGHFE